MNNGPLADTVFALALLFAFSSQTALAAESGDYFSPRPAAQVKVEAETTPLRITLGEAVLLCLKNNRSLAVEKYNPAIAATAEDIQRGAFDTTVTGQAVGNRNRAETGDAVNSATVGIGASRTDENGLTIEGEADVTTVTGNKGMRTPAQDSVNLSLTVTQPLLRGSDAEANLASVRQARLDADISAFELRGFAQNLVASVENAFWDYYLAERRIEIVEQSLDLALAEQNQTEERIRLGKLPELELSAAQAEVALRREAVIDAKSRLATARLTLARLTGTLANGGARREIILIDPNQASSGQADNADDHVKLAMTARPELNETRLRIRRNELEVIKTKDGLLPKLDAFVTLGKSGYAESLAKAFGALDDRSYAVSVGVRGDLPWEKTSQKAYDKRAALTVEQAKEALGNLRELAEVDVRKAHIDAMRFKEQIVATGATRKLREDTLFFETEKHRVGRSTSLVVATAQRDLLESRINEAEAAINYSKSLVELFRQDGSLLNRRGIKAPGDGVAEPFPGE